MSDHKSVPLLTKELAAECLPEIHGWAFRPTRKHPFIHALEAIRDGTAVVVPASQHGWQPIACAPKDGRTIIVGRDMGNFGWVEGTSHWHSVSGIDGWISRGFGAYGELGLGNPTHWHPLSKPPHD